MGRPRKGSSYLKHGVWTIAVTTDRPGAKKPRLVRPCGELAPPPAGFVITAEYAAEVARSYQHQYDNGTWDPWSPKPVAPARETLKQYAVRWLADRRDRRGLRSVHDDASRLAHWVEPTLGERPIADITRDEVEQVRDDLDAHVRDEHLSWKTASNVWGVLVTLLRDAAGSKVRALRVRADNPATGVAPPDTGRAKAKSYLYPSESSALATLATQPGEDVEQIALFLVDAYEGLRIGELGALECRDIDLAHDDIHVHQALDGKTLEVRECKTAASNRHVPIEPAIKPLIAALVARRGGVGRLFPVVPAQRDAAKNLRAALRRAGVTRDALFADDTTRKNITVHDLRSTALTWWAVRGDDAVKIQRRAGHEDFNTTLGYIREAESRRAGFGTVFPAIPAALLEALGAEGSATGAATEVPPANAFTPGNAVSLEVPAAGVEPSQAATADDTARHHSVIGRTAEHHATPDGTPSGGSATGGSRTLDGSGLELFPADDAPFRPELAASWARGSLWVTVPERGREELPS